MKLTIIPDVHGRPFWRDAVKDLADTPVVFLGDYLDPYPQDMVTWDDALQGLHDIIELKKKNPEQVTLLLGNHDVQDVTRVFPTSSHTPESGIAGLSPM